MKPTKIDITPKMLDFWIANNLNVMLEGEHGVGKTGMIVEAFERNGVSYHVMSASTLDPWVDFVGVPKEVKDGDKSFIELVRPKKFALGEVEFLFIDEYNRAPSKVKNAVMELIQFKSINGEPLPNLKAVWAAINPADDADDRYDVVEMDAAQLDRFHVYIRVPYRPSVQYFKKKYPEHGAMICKWWESLESKAQKHISPRRLDFLVGYVMNGGNPYEVVNSGIKKVDDLVQMLAFNKTKTVKEVDSIIASIVSSNFKGPKTHKLVQMAQDNNITGKTVRGHLKKDVEKMKIVAVAFEHYKKGTFGKVFKEAPRQYFSDEATCDQFIKDKGLTGSVVDIVNGLKTTKGSAIASELFFKEPDLGYNHRTIRYDKLRKDNTSVFVDSSAKYAIINGMKAASINGSPEPDDIFAITIGVMLRSQTTFDLKKNILEKCSMPDELWNMLNDFVTRVENRESIVDDFDSDEKILNPWFVGLVMGHTLTNHDAAGFKSMQKYYSVRAAKRIRAMNMSFATEFMRICNAQVKKLRIILDKNEI